MLTEQTVRALAADCGIEVLGFHDAVPLTAWLPILEERREAGRFTDFENVPPAERIDFDQALPGVKAVIVAAFPVSSGAEPPADMAGRGRMASVAWGRDYHLRVTEGLEALAQKITAALKTAVNYKIYVDNSKLLDRASAWQAGLGFFGKNNLLINPRYGSLFFIGQLLLDVPLAFERTVPLESRCGDCERCLRVCPGGALEEGVTLRPDRCVSYLTQKKTLTPVQETLMADYLYGCDLCQRCCPFNAEVLKKLTAGGDTEKIYPSLEKLMAMSNQDFKKIYGATAAGWRGKKIIARNAAIIKNRRKNCNNAKKNDIINNV